MTRVATGQLGNKQRGICEHHNEVQWQLRGADIRSYLAPGAAAIPDALRAKLRPCRARAERSTDTRN